MPTKSGFAAHSIIVIGLVLGSFVLLFVFLISKGYLKAPNIGLGNKPKVEIKTEYSNPFKQEAQYVNPFDTYKSPFLSLK